MRIHLSPDRGAAAHGLDTRDRSSPPHGKILTNTHIHANRRLPAIVDALRLPWLASPELGVERRMLERSGGEVALATSIVRYAPGARFAAHSHGAGEEFLVLSGTFSDENGDYPEGTYVRNPPGSTHAPFSARGCVIFVKLRQMLADEPHLVRVRPEERTWRRTTRGGIEQAPLYANARIRVALLRVPPGARLPARRIPGGEELLVVRGAISLLGSRTRELGVWGWRRSAAQRQPQIASPAGALLWMKQGHL